MNFPKKIQLKHLFAIMLVCMVAFTSVGYILGSNGGTFTLSSGIYPGAPSYTIWREGDVYYAKNAYGVIDYSGTNFTAIIESCIDNLGVGGIIGSIFVIAGTYTISAYILVTGSDLVLEGEGDSTVFVADDALDSQVVYVSSGNNVTLRNFKIDGNKGGQTAWGNGIFVLSSINVLIEDVTVEECYENGISLSSSDRVEIKSSSIEDNNLRGITVSNSNNTSIHHNYINNNGLGDTAQAGIHIGGTSQVVDISHNTVSNTQGNSANVSGIKLFTINAPDKITKGIVANNIVHSNVGQGIWVIDSEHVVVCGNSVYNNSFTGIYVEKSYNALVDGNQIFENGHEGIAITSYGGVRSDFAIVQSNIITANGYNGLYAGNNFGSALGNTIRNNGQSGSQYDQWNGIYVLGPNWTVQSNMLVDDQGTVTQKFGISMNGITSDNCTIFGNVMRGLTTALNIPSTSDNTWVALNDFRFNTDDVGDQGTDTTWTDNWSISSFHENTAPDD